MTLEVGVKDEGGTLLHLGTVATAALLQDAHPRLQHLLKGLHVELILMVQLQQDVYKTVSKET